MQPLRQTLMQVQHRHHNFYVILSRALVRLRRHMHRAADAVLVRISEVTVETLHFVQGDTIRE